MSVFFPTVERHSLGGWPDGITPGFVELGAAPNTALGFQAPVKSIAKVGSVYYEKTGAAATAWAPLPLALPTSGRKQGEWYPWGGRDYSDGGAGAEFVAGAGIVGAGAVGQMLAMLAFFPEPITITALAAGLTNDSPVAACGSWSLAPDVPVAGNHYPGPNVVASVTTITGGGTGARKLRGQSGLSLVIPGPCWYWAVFQTFQGFGAGGIWIAFDRREWPALFGVQSMTGKIVGDTLPASPISYAGGFGFETPVASIPVGGVGVNFPAGMTALLSSSTSSVMWGSAGCPYLFYQFTRA